MLRHVVSIDKTLRELTAALSDKDWKRADDASAQINFRTTQLHLAIKARAQKG
jgi:hypothetical protein